MTLQTLDKLIWTLVYGGLIGVALGLSIERSDAALGWSFIIVGAATSLVGAILDSDLRAFAQEGQPMTSTPHRRHTGESRYPLSALLFDCRMTAALGAGDPGFRRDDVCGGAAR